MFNLDDYETVEERLVKFWKDYPDGRISTSLVEATANRFIVRAEVYRTFVDAQPWGTGLAFEIVSDRGVNSTSALENAETSALGRALACVGYATKNKRPSREEMSKVAAKEEVKAKIQEVKAKMADTSKEYVPVEKADDPWTISSAAPVTTMEQAVEMVKDVLGGTPIDESCKHGARVWKTGTSKAGKQYGMWKCNVSRQNTQDEPCDPIWYEISSDGTWKPQVKR